MIELQAVDAPVRAPMRYELVDIDSAANNLTITIDIQPDGTARLVVANIDGDFNAVDVPVDQLTGLSDDIRVAVNHHGGL